MAQKWFDNTVLFFIALNCITLAMERPDIPPDSDVSWSQYSGLDRMVVGFTTTCAIDAYHHKSCEFEPRYGKVYPIQHYVIKFVTDLR